MPDVTEHRDAPTLRALFRCPSCGAELDWSERAVTCRGCKQATPVRDGIPRFVDLGTHENFSIQWRRFRDIQLDSRNGTRESEDRLLFQSGMTAADFRGKTVLEVGSGAGRFTEILLKYGARVVSTDYSGAVDANSETHRAAIASGQLVTAQSDVFALPFAKRAFDLVVGWGMLQHTGDAERALRCLWEHVRPGGSLLVDRYQLDAAHFLPFKYALRPLIADVPPARMLEVIEAVCRKLVPIERRILGAVQGDGWRKAVRLVVNRAPNSVYPINLELQGKLDPETALKWSILDTFDQYAPRFDAPCTASSWRRQLGDLPGGEITLCSSGGQGNTGVVRRRA